jgi:hypothetical protein
LAQADEIAIADNERILDVRILVSVGYIDMPPTQILAIEQTDRFFIGCVNWDGECNEQQDTKRHVRSPFVMNNR